MACCIQRYVSSRQLSNGGISLEIFSNLKTSPYRNTAPRRYGSTRYIASEPENVELASQAGCNYQHHASESYIKLLFRDQMRWLSMADVCYLMSQSVSEDELERRRVGARFG